MKSGEEEKAQQQRTKPNDYQHANNKSTKMKNKTKVTAAQQYRYIRHTDAQAATFWLLFCRLAQNALSLDLVLTCGRIGEVGGRPAHEPHAQRLQCACTCSAHAGQVPQPRLCWEYSAKISRTKQHVQEGKIIIQQHCSRVAATQFSQLFKVMIDGCLTSCWNLKL